MAQEYAVKVVKIGNSRGIRIPKALLEQLGIEDEVLLSIEGDELHVKPRRKVRAGWAESMTALAEAGDDALIHGEPLPTAFDEEEWTW